MSNGISIAGRFNKDKHDYYQTPSIATEKLLSVEIFRGQILEPCCGAGAITKILKQHGYKVHSSDIRTDDDVDGFTGVNIFSLTGKFDNIVTNPPYNNAEGVIRKSLSLAVGKVAMLLKLTFLESEKRASFFKEHPPARIWVFKKRVTMHPEGMGKPKNSGTITFAWFVWEKGIIRPPRIGWI